MLQTMSWCSPWLSYVTSIFHQSFQLKLLIFKEHLHHPGLRLSDRVTMVASEAVESLHSGGVPLLDAHLLAGGPRTGRESCSYVMSYELNALPL